MIMITFIFNVIIYDYIVSNHDYNHDYIVHNTSMSVIIHLFTQLHV